MPPSAAGGSSHSERHHNERALGRKHASQNTRECVAFTAILRAEETHETKPAERSATRGWPRGACHGHADCRRPELPDTAGADRIGLSARRHQRHLCEVARRITARLGILAALTLDSG